MELTTPSPFIGNAGKFVCFEGATCPTAIGGVAAVTTTITGRINRSSSGSDRPTVSTIEIDGGQCSVLTEQNQYYTYQCVINWSGWIGSGFDADLTLTVGDGNVLCSENTLGTIVPGTTIIRFTNENPPTENQVIPDQDMVIGYTQTQCPP